jgi:cephalosporin hydroxylase
MAIMTRHRFDLLTAIAVSLVVGSSARSVWDQTAKSPIDRFHQIYYNDPDNTWESTTWLGVRTEKVPLDTWMMQEIIYETKPDVLLETGTFKGGSGPGVAFGPRATP